MYVWMCVCRCFCMWVCRVHRVFDESPLWIFRDWKTQNGGWCNPNTFCWFYYLSFMCFCDPNLAWYFLTLTIGCSKVSAHIVCLAHWGYWFSTSLDNKIHNRWDDSLVGFDWCTIKVTLVVSHVKLCCTNHNLPLQML